VLAFGQVFFGHPGWAFGSALLDVRGAVLDAARLPAARMGAVWVAAVRAAVRILSYWMNSYWGGAVAACGGMLILGALRECCEPVPLAGLLDGIGIAILANTRPYEGAVLAVLVMLLLCWRNWKERPSRCCGRRQSWRWSRLAAWRLYFQRTTGNPLRMPYVVYREAARLRRILLFQSPRPDPAWNHDVLREFYISELHDYTVAREHPFRLRAEAAVVVAILHRLHPDAAADRFSVSGRSPGRGRDGLLSLSFWAVAIVPQVWFSPHYAAPATGLVIIAVTAVCTGSIPEARGW